MSSAIVTQADLERTVQLRLDSNLRLLPVLSWEKVWRRFQRVTAQEREEIL